MYFSYRKLYIADARPRKNALANGAMGGGSESSSNYFQSEVCNGLEMSIMIFFFLFFSDVNLIWFSKHLHSYLYCQIVFFGIDNIHAMRESFARLREYLDTHGRASSDGMSSFLVSPRILKRFSYLCPWCLTMNMACFGDFDKFVPTIIRLKLDLLLL